MTDAVHIRPVADDGWDVVAWVWQLYRHDLATVVGSRPYPDGRYKHAVLDRYPAADRAGYLAWEDHPNAAEPAPVGLALVDGLDGERRSIAAFGTHPLTRRTGLGTRLALDVLGRHPGPWAIAFQHDNAPAAAFWRRVAEAAFGAAWTEEQRPVPGRPEVPADHWITTT